MKTKHLIILSAGIVLFNSCATSSGFSNRNIQKRKYTKGWHMGNGSNKRTVQSNEKTEKIKASENNVFEERAEQLPIAQKLELSEKRAIGISSLQSPKTHSETKQAELFPKHFRTLEKSRKVNESKCDVIMLKNGEEIEAKVTEIGTSEIKYKTCDNLEGPTFTVPKYDVFKIKYANGTSTLISSISNSKSPLSPSGGSSDAMTLAIISFGLGMLGIFVFWLLPIVTLIMGVVSIILGAVALGKVKGDNSAQALRAKSYAIWGIVFGVLSLLLGVASLVLFALIF